MNDPEGDSTVPRLSVRHLSTSFPTEAGLIRSVGDVSFSILPGRTTALVGESGSGKSVTSLTLMGRCRRPPMRGSAARRRSSAAMAAWWTC